MSILNLIDEFNDLLISLEDKMFKSLDTSKRNDVIQRSRLALNDIAKNITKSALSDKTLEKDYVKKYNEIASKLDDKIKIKQIGKESNKELQELKGEFVDSIVESIELTQKAFEQKVNFFDSYLKKINVGSAFTPRIVLFQPGRFWKEDEKDVIKKHYNETVRDIEKEINKQVKEGQTYPKTAKNITGILRKQYPDGNVPIPRRYTDKKTGKTKVTMTSMPIERYADTWAKDMAQMNGSMAVVSSIKTAGYDLVKVGGGVTDNALCDPYSTPPAIYSLEGKVVGYPILTKYPPYHPNCSKYLTVTSDMKKLQEGIKKKEKPKYDRKEIEENIENQIIEIYEDSDTYVGRKENWIERVNKRDIKVAYALKNIIQEQEGMKLWIKGVPIKEEIRFYKDKEVKTIKDFDFNKYREIYDRSIETILKENTHVSRDKHGNIQEFRAYPTKEKRISSVNLDNMILSFGNDKQQVKTNEEKIQHNNIINYVLKGKKYD